jgi:hypothetical protein
MGLLTLRRVKLGFVTLTAKLNTESQASQCIYEDDDSLQKDF